MGFPEINPTGRVPRPHLIYITTKIKGKKKKSSSFGKQKTSDTISEIHGPFSNFIHLSHFTIQSSWIKSRQVPWGRTLYSSFRQTNTIGAPHFLPYNLSSSSEEMSAHYFCMINKHNFISLFLYWNFSSSILDCISPPDTHTHNYEVLEGYHQVLSIFPLYTFPCLLHCIELKL